jgi:hypothetical protein
MKQYIMFKDKQILEMVEGIKEENKLILDQIHQLKKQNEELVHETHELAKKVENTNITNGILPTVYIPSTVL